MFHKPNSLMLSRIRIDKETSTTADLTKLTLSILLTLSITKDSNSHNTPETLPYPITICVTCAKPKTYNNAYESLFIKCRLCCFRCVTQGNSTLHSPPCRHVYWLHLSVWSGVVDSVNHLLTILTCHRVCL